MDMLEVLRMIHDDNYIPAPSVTSVTGSYLSYLEKTIVVNESTISPEQQAEAEYQKLIKPWRTFKGFDGVHVETNRHEGSDWEAWRVAYAKKDHRSI